CSLAFFTPICSISESGFLRSFICIRGCATRTDHQWATPLLLFRRGYQSNRHFCYCLCSDTSVSAVDQNNLTLVIRQPTTGTNFTVMVCQSSWGKVVRSTATL